MFNENNNLRILNYFYRRGCFLEKASLASTSKALLFFEMYK